MRIVFLAPLGKIGGAERILLDVMASVRRAEPEWELFLLSGSTGPLLSQAADLGVHAEALQFPRFLAELGDAGENSAAGAGRLTRLAWLMARLARAAVPVFLYRRKLARRLDDLRPDIVHTNGLKMHVLGVWSRPKKAALVWHIHDYVSQRPLMARLLRRYASHCSMSIANSRSVAEDLLKLNRECLSTRTILNAVDVTHYSPAGHRLDLDAISGMPPAPAGTVRIGMVATMARWKGHEVFLKALASLPKSSLVRGYIVGGPVYQTPGSQHSIEELRTIAKRVGAEHVGFTGYLADTAGAIRSLDIVVHASTSPEPFGLVIAEAMACGRAVIYSRAGGAIEVGGSGSNALSHHPGDVGQLAACMLTLIDNPALRSRLGCAAREDAVRRFDRNRLASQFVPLYQLVAGSEVKVPA